MNIVLCFGKKKKMRDINKCSNRNITYLEIKDKVLSSNLKTKFFIFDSLSRTFNALAIMFFNMILTSLTTPLYVNFISIAFNYTNNFF